MHIFRLGYCSLTFTLIFYDLWPLFLCSNCNVLRIINHLSKCWSLNQCGPGMPLKCVPVVTLLCFLKSSFVIWIKPLVSSLSHVEQFFFKKILFQHYHHYIIIISLMATLQSSFWHFDVNWGWWNVFFLSKCPTLE